MISPLPWPEAPVTYWICQTCGISNKILKDEPDPYAWRPLWIHADGSADQCLPGRIGCQGCGYGVGVERKSDALWVNALWAIRGKPIDVWRAESIKKLEEFQKLERQFDDFCRRIPEIRVEREQARQEQAARKQSEERKDAENRKILREASRTRVGLQQMNPIAFELAVGSLYEALGHKVYVTRASGDGGIDLVLEKDARKIAVQCKRQNKPVGEPTLREFYGSYVDVFDGGIFVTSSSFTGAGKEWASRREGLSLVDVTQLVELMTQAKPELKRDFELWRL